jgi:hypothetical protein
MFPVLLRSLRAKRQKGNPMIAKFDNVSQTAFTALMTFIASSENSIAADEINIPENQKESVSAVLRNKEDVPTEGPRALYNVVAFIDGSSNISEVLKENKGHEPRYKVTLYIPLQIWIWQGDMVRRSSVALPSRIMTTVSELLALEGRQK